MKNYVIIKSFQNGISVYLDSDIPFEALLQEVAMKFQESSKFFQNAKLAISFEGRYLTEVEEREILEVITENSKIEVVCVVGKDAQKNEHYLHALEELIHLEEDDYGRFYRGTLKNGQVLETESTIIMMGDVHPGSSIISTKNIIIIGGLYGEAYAGANGDSNHIIVALDMSPSRIKIGDLRYKFDK